MGRRFDHLGDVEAFIIVAEKGSMTEAAVALATTASVLSRAITRLETRLGAQLMRRTTRRLSLTDEGRAYLEQARAAFSMIDDAERAIQGPTGASLTGHVRISVPTTYGHYRLPAMLERFMQAYPEVQIAALDTKQPRRAAPRAGHHERQTLVFSQVFDMQGHARPFEIMRGGDKT